MMPCGCGKVMLRSVGLIKIYQRRALLMAWSVLMHCI